jgi:hypothetical protein
MLFFEHSVCHKRTFSRSAPVSKEQRIMPRMKILNAVEQDTFASPLVFTTAQRRHHFDFPSEVRQLAATLRTPTNQLGFLLSWGYFTVTKQFFLPQTFRSLDMEYVARDLSLSLDAMDLTSYDKQTVARHQELILQYAGFRAFDASARTVLGQEIAGMVRAQLKPRLIFWRCVDLLIREKVAVPTYFRLADLILTAINHQKQTLTTMLAHTLSEQTQVLLDGLFVQSPTLDGEPVDSQTAAYKLTLLKKLSQSTKPAKIKERVTDLTVVCDLHARLHSVLATLALPPDGIRYYANSVLKSEISRLPGALMKTAICTSSPSSLISITASKTTSSMSCSPPRKATRTVRSASTRTSAMPSGRSAISSSRPCSGLWRNSS